MVVFGDIAEPAASCANLTTAPHVTEPLRHSGGGVTRRVIWTPTGLLAQAGKENRFNTATAGKPWPGRGSARCTTKVKRGKAAEDPTAHRWHRLPAIAAFCADVQVLRPAASPASPPVATPPYW
jgi:hypothetical protein